MADKHDSTSGVTDIYEESDAAYCNGTKKELLDRGLFRPEWFPGVGKNNKREVVVGIDVLRAAGFNPLVAEVRIVKDENTPNKFDVQMSYTEEETARREAIWRAEFEDRAYQEAVNLANGWLDGLPNSADAFKRAGAWQIERQVEIIFDCMGSKRGGYSFTKKTIREFEDAIKLACNILRNGEVEYSKHERDNAVRQSVSEAFNRGMSLSFTGHERNRWIERFIREREQDIAAAHA